MSRPLETVQQWVQAVVTHPDGVEGGVESDEAQALIRLPRGELEAVIRRSRNLTAAERISILPGVLFSATGRYKNYIRINCAHVWTKTHDRALQTLGRLCERQAQG